MSSLTDKIWKKRIGWLEHMSIWTEEEKDKFFQSILPDLQRDVQKAECLEMIKQARKLVGSNELIVSDYLREIESWRKEILLTPRRCTNTMENHEHAVRCGSCLECLGTGRTLILFPSRSRGAKCIACKGTGIRSQEFELGDGLIEAAHAELEMHLSSIDDMQFGDVREEMMIGLETEPEEDRLEIIKAIKSNPETETIIINALKN